MHIPPQKIALIGNMHKARKQMEFEGQTLASPEDVAKVLPFPSVGNQMWHRILTPRSVGSISEYSS